MGNFNGNVLAQKIAKKGQKPDLKTLIIDRDFKILAIAQDYRMVGTVKRHIVSGISRIRNPDALDHTHTTRVNSIMPFHSHNHGNGRDIPENDKKICMESEQFISLNVKCSDASKEFEELEYQRIKE
jgi:hypothetical protein